MHVRFLHHLLSMMKMMSLSSDDRQVLLVDYPADRPMGHDVDFVGDLFRM